MPFRRVVSQEIIDQAQDCPNDFICLDIYEVCICTVDNKYKHGLPDELPAWKRPLPFAYESTGEETQFTNGLDPDPRSRQVFSFHRRTLRFTVFSFRARNEKYLCKRLFDDSYSYCSSSADKSSCSLWGSVTIPFS